MGVAKKKMSRKQPSGLRTAVLLLALLAVALLSYVWYSMYFNNGSHVPAHRTAETTPSPVFTPVSTPHFPLPIRPSDYQDVPPVASDKRLPASPLHGSTSARLAIIIDDMGNSLAEAKSLAAIKLPLTISIIPGLRSDRQVSAFAAEQHIEQMIHIPMQPKGWPTQRLEQNGLLVSQSPEELQERMAEFMKRFPGAVGANNHMGSEFSEREEQMVVVLQMLKKNNLFFIDSVTSPRSCGFRLAKSGGIPTARRNIFLDNTQERTYILGQLNQAVNYAQKHGSAIAICHPHPVTISTLAAALPGLAAQGIQLVPASALVN